MNKQDWYIVGGTVLALGLIYYFFMYKPKPKTTTTNTTQTTQQSYTGDISQDLTTAGASGGDSGDLSTAGR